jgi:hypothetical protein
MDPDEFAPLIGGLMAATGLNLTDRGIEVWRRDFLDIPDDVLRSAFRRARYECKGFPTVALIREYAAQVVCGVLPTHGEAFGRVMKAARCFGRCVGCVPHCGKKCVEQRAERYVGPLCWRAVRSLGG